MCLTSAGVLFRLDDWVVVEAADDVAAAAFGDRIEVLLAPELSTSTVGTATIRMGLEDVFRFEWLGDRGAPPTEESAACTLPPLLSFSFSLALEVKSFESLFMMMDS